MRMSAAKKRSIFSTVLFLLLSSARVALSKDPISIWGEGYSLEETGFDPTKVTQVSWNPRAFIYKGFLSHEECDHLIELGRDKLEKSMVVDDETGESILSEIRTSSGTFLQKHQDEIVNRIERRIAAWTFLPEEHGEAIQILHYEKGQKYGAHHDYFTDNYSQAIGGHRMATALMYLSDVEMGGETVFPGAKGKHLQQKDDSWSGCAKDGFAVKPKKGDTLLFFSCHPNATVDPLSLHASCPVIEGEKWSAAKWIHVRPFVIHTEDERMDGNENCPRWAAEVECEKNNFYMVGTNETLGYCRKSCEVCGQEESEPTLIEPLVVKEATAGEEPAVGCVDEDKNCPDQRATNGECEENACGLHDDGRTNETCTLGYCRKSTCRACEA